MNQKTFLYAILFVGSTLVLSVISIVVRLRGLFRRCPDLGTDKAPVLRSAGRGLSVVVSGA